MKNTAIAAGLGLAAGIGIGAWIAFREMGTVIVGTVKQYDATTRVAARATEARPKRQNPIKAIYDAIDPQTETRAQRVERSQDLGPCVCGQKVKRGEQRVPCPRHGPSYFDSVPVAAV